MKDVCSCGAPLDAPRFFKLPSPSGRTVWTFAMCGECVVSHGVLMDEISPDEYVVRKVLEE